MSTAIIIMIIIVICIYSIKSYLKKLSHGCCGGESDEPVKRIQPKDSHIKNYSFCETMTIEGMTCQNCQRRIENAFNECDGFYMKVNLKKHSAKLYTKEKVKHEDIKSKVAALGYRVSHIESEFDL